MEYYLVKMILAYLLLVKRELSTEINKIDINIFIANRLQSTNLSTIERKVAESGGILKFVVDIQQKLARNDFFFCYEPLKCGTFFQPLRSQPSTIWFSSREQPIGIF